MILDAAVPEAYRTIRASFLVGLIFLVSGCGEDADFWTILAAGSNHRRADARPGLRLLFPYYVELCALSQWSLREGAVATRSDMR